MAGRGGLRVLVVTNLYPGGRIPERGIFVQTQVESLRALGHELRVVFVDGARGRGEYLRGVAEARAALRDQEFDLVHAHYGYSGVVAALARGLAGGTRRLPLVVTYLGSDVLSPAQRPWSRLAARIADRNVVMSEEMKSRLAAPRTVVIPNGTALDRFSPIPWLEARAVLGIGAEEFLVLFPWNPARPEKRAALAQSAVHALGARISSARAPRLLPFFGEPQARLNLALNASDALLLTSSWEGSPNAVREALAVGLPVVSVRVGDAPEILRGLSHSRVVSANAERLADALASIQAERVRRGEPVRESARGRLEPYGVLPIARRVEQVYRSVTSNPS